MLYFLYTHYLYIIFVYDNHLSRVDKNTRDLYIIINLSYLYKHIKNIFLKMKNQYEFEYLQMDIALINDFNKN